jgi:DUF4097 and DUF4098 domain-containing protein YvlB
VKAGKLLLLLTVLAFGAFIEAAWRVRGHIDVGPSGCRVLRGKFYGPSHTYESESRKEVTDESVEVANAFGSVRVSAGAPGVVRTKLRTVVYMPSEQEARTFAAKVLLASTLEGGTLRLTTNRADLDARDVGFETHLEVEVPSTARVIVRNEHGHVDVSDVATADVENSYDSVLVERVKGAAVLKNRHGDVTAATIGGTLSLSARYGDVEVRDVTGRTSLESEHGDVSLARVAGLEGQARYGDFRAEAIGGDLVFRGEHAEVSVSDVSGGASVETSYKDVTVAKVAGDVKLKSAHGSLSASEIRGALDAETSYNDVTLARIDGPVEVRVEHGGVHAERLARGAHVTASGDDVEIEGFKGALTVETRRGSVHLVPDGPLTETITASAANGGITLEVPGGSSFQLVAVAESGEVQVDVQGFAATESSPARVAGAFGGGGSLVKLSADHGDVRIESRAAVASEKSEKEE